MKRPKRGFETNEPEPIPPHVTFSIRVPKEYKAQLRKIGSAYKKKPNKVISEILAWGIDDQIRKLKKEGRIADE